MKNPNEQKTRASEPVRFAEVLKLPALMLSALMLSLALAASAPAQNQRATETMPAFSPSPPQRQQPGAEQRRQQRGTAQRGQTNQRTGQNAANVPVTQQPPLAQRQQANPFGDPPNWFEQLKASIAPYSIVVMMLPGFLTIGGVIFLIWYFRSDNIGSRTAHGSAEWASDKELKNDGFLKSNREIAAGELVVARQGKAESVILPALIAARHCGVVGPSGTGKSRKMFMPNIQFLANKASMFVHDTSGELWTQTSGLWDRTARFAPDEPERSASFNWIPLCTDENALETFILAETIITNGDESHSRDKFWDQTATDLLAGIFAHAATTKTPTLAFAYDLIVGLTLEELEAALMQSPSRMAREEGMKIRRAEEKTRKNILSGMTKSLRFLRDEKVRRFTSGTSKPVDFRSLREKNTAIYWCVPDTLAKILRPLTCLATKLMMNQLKERAGNVCYLMLDEFDTLGRIPDFEGDITLLRKRKVIVVAGVQSLSQLEKNYGRDSARIILEGLQSMVVLSGLKGQIAEEISRWLGEFTMIEQAVAKSDGGGWGNKTTTTRSVRKHARRLMTADEIRKLDESQALIISTNKKPFIKGAYWYDENIAPRVMKTREAKTLTQEIPRALPEGIKSSSGDGGAAERQRNGTGKKTMMPEPPRFED